LDEVADLLALAISRASARRMSAQGIRVRLKTEGLRDVVRELQGAPT
jgi:hypothetical protein